MILPSGGDQIAVGAEVSVLFHGCQTFTVPNPRRQSLRSPDPRRRGWNAMMLSSSHTRLLGPPAHQGDEEDVAANGGVDGERGEGVGGGSISPRNALRRARAHAEKVHKDSLGRGMLRHVRCRLAHRLCKIAIFGVNLLLHGWRRHRRLGRLLLCGFLFHRSLPAQRLSVAHWSKYTT